MELIKILWYISLSSMLVDTKVQLKTILNQGELHLMMIQCYCRVISLAAIKDSLPTKNKTVHEKFGRGKFPFIHCISIYSKVGHDVQSRFFLCHFRSCVSILWLELITRCVSVAPLMYIHISWKEDTMVVELFTQTCVCKHKTSRDLPNLIFCNICVYFGHPS